MAGKQHNLSARAAEGGRRFLKLFLVFFLGFVVAHTDTVQRIEKNAGNGELADAVFSNVNDSYDQQIFVQGIPHALQGGAVLIGPEFSRRLALLLVGEGGQILHRWTVDNDLFNPEIGQWWKKLAAHAE